MTEAVIVSTARSPIGRAMKGSLVEVRPDDLTATIVKAALDKVPQLDRSTIDDLILGCGQPAGESGFNLARVAALLAGLDDVPGVTINRYCSSSLQSIRMAAHAIKAGEGDVFVAAGVETVSRYVNGMSDTGPHNPLFAEAEARTGKLADGADSWEPLSGLPDIYIAMGQTAENVRLKEGVARRDMDEFAARSQQLAVANQENGYWDGEITPITTPSGTVVIDADNAYNPFGEDITRISRRTTETGGPLRLPDRATLDLAAGPVINPAHLEGHFGSVAGPVPAPLPDGYRRQRDRLAGGVAGALDRHDKAAEQGQVGDHARDGDSPEPPLRSATLSPRGGDQEAGDGHGGQTGDPAVPIRCRWKALSRAAHGADEQGPKCHRSEEDAGRQPNRQTAMGSECEQGDQDGADAVGRRERRPRGRVHVQPGRPAGAVVRGPRRQLRLGRARRQAEPDRRQRDGRGDGRRVPRGGGSGRSGVRAVPPDDPRRLVAPPIRGAARRGSAPARRAGPPLHRRARTSRRRRPGDRRPRHRASRPAADAPEKRRDR